MSYFPRLTDEQQRQGQLANQAGREMDKAISESLEKNGAEVKRLWSEHRSDALGLRCTSWDAVAFHHAVWHGEEKPLTLYERPKQWRVRLVPEESDV